MSEINTEIIRKYNEIKNLTELNENILFNYIYSDGFNERLLNADLRIDFNYDFSLFLNAFQHSEVTKNKSDQLKLNGKIPQEIILLVEQIIFGNYCLLKKRYDYETFSITDVEVQFFLFNIDDSTTNITIEGNLPHDYFKTSIEKKLFELNEYLKKWIDKKYQEWML